VNANRCIADHLRIASLEQVRAIFDAGEIGVILIGMPGLEKKLARYPQFYSRIGSVREFRPLVAKEAREVLERRWSPPGVCLPQQPLDAETVASIIRITGPCQYLCVNSLSNPVVRFKIAVT
jgi:DNA transposition AAA+ family ATPase